MSLFAAVMAALVIGCAKDPKALVITEANKQTWADEIKDMKGLTADEGRMLLALRMRQGMADARRQPGPVMVGKSVAELIADQKMFEAEAERLASQAAAAEAARAETWNGQRVYLETDVDESPMLFKPEVPKPPVSGAASITLSWIVTPDGVVVEPRIEVSASPELSAFVLDAVKKWRYAPAKKGGVAVPVRVERKYTFGKR